MPLPYDPRAKPKIAYTGEGRVMSFFPSDFGTAFPEANLFDRTSGTLRAIGMERRLQESGLTDPSTNADFSKWPTKFDVFVEFKADHVVVRSQNASKRFSSKGIFQDGDPQNIGEFDAHEQAKDKLFEEIFRYIRFLLKKKRRPLSVHPGVA